MDTLFRNSRRKLSQGLLFWREAGQGIPVILLHGAWNDSSQWVPLIDLLSDNFHCLAPDLLGFGESDNPNIHYSIDLQVECLAEFLTALKLEKVFLVGHSLGGWIATSYALKHPEQVHGLVLLSPEGVKIEKQEKQWQRMQRVAKLSPFIFKVLKLLSPLIKIVGLQEKVQQYLQLRNLMLQYPTGCQLLFDRKPPEVEAELLQNQLSLIEFPVLILQGGKDTAEAIAKSQIYAQSLPNSEFKMVAHAGNDLPESCVGVIAEDIREYIKK
ncbi:MULTISPECIES: alpha/beta fold hydrolase [unclassified Tolypothrix]|uniref:alpha/beta fold hydrolase n=1 Tax=unclassified Tolypothrix TaxID=2649714 RepID=UPI0005EAADE3|nr:MULTISPECIES: alpha/beta hydrolase [unclassified Tolypothrix]BAY91722.1 alpha/beta hydrolase fold protein [Microchaete diplosiphon NIES-3275]EKF05151.1 hydrolase, alpha/beta fold family protein [Tolypothrix sp. PCC 7601]MBE9087459.1 alpha/beta hydrolase [Tolypothrix sp. LEGE 11397]UYD25739.1 alpha/beta hydrolase [Tolypothrix sp. PCC 7712]UYD32020.1 alpha/beta hydrolase [Tolypothrix sp. PCC 7601]